MSAESLAAKRREADRARDRLLAQAHALQARLKPAAVVEQVRDELKRGAENGAERVVTEARKRPVAVGFAAAGVAALLAAPPLLRLARGRRHHENQGHGPGHGDDDGGQAQDGAEGRGRRARKRER